MNEDEIRRLIDERIDAALAAMADHAMYDKPGPVPAPAAEKPLLFCAAKTREGSPCGHYARPGGKFCRYHSGTAMTFAPSTQVFVGDREVITATDPFVHAADVLDQPPSPAVVAAVWRELHARVIKMGSLLRMMGIEPKADQ